MKYYIVDRYVLQYPDGRFVALDYSSGGEPYAAENLFGAQIWLEIDLERAKAYMHTFEKENFTLLRIDSVELTPNPY